ncbi:PhzF family phenazine biosynthesis protein [Nesterenkonia muleiensis]|uniref:PhzF family phenazine biosynthesis protein n=1 Tax=Nesterenkonia muleiensis TaxID=2282648 RepID=UPI00192E6C8D|nr:PhzF family phenazine biosynthesis protein [Nesterenkonia muleiensis]
MLPPSSSQADYRVRIFTLDREMPFAGHPTLGACHVWLTIGGEPRNRTEIIQECGAGPAKLRQDENAHLSFVAPPLIRSGMAAQTELREAQEVLGVDAENPVGQPTQLRLRVRSRLCLSRTGSRRRFTVFGIRWVVEDGAQSCRECFAFPLG